MNTTNNLISLTKGQVKQIAIDINKLYFTMYDDENNLITFERSNLDNNTVSNPLILNDIREQIQSKAINILDINKNIIINNLANQLYISKVFYSILVSIENIKK